MKGEGQWPQSCPGAVDETKQEYGGNIRFCKFPIHFLHSKGDDQNNFMVQKYQYQDEYYHLYTVLYIPVQTHSNFTL